MAKTKEITPTEYAWSQGCSVQNIRFHFTKTGIENLPGVLEVKHYSRFYLFVVNNDMFIPSTDPKTRRK